MVAPLIGALIKAGLPVLAQTLADKGKEWVEEKTGVVLPDLKTPELNHEQTLALRKVEIEHEEFLVEHALKSREQELEKYKAELQDISSARQMQIAALNGADEFSKRYLYWLTTFLITASFVYIFLITFWTIPENNIRFADTILGFILGTVIGMILTFFYGASRGGENVAAALKKVTEKLTDKEQS